VINASGREEEEVDEDGFIVSKKVFAVEPQT
jgi:hypothetical protein